MPSPAAPMAVALQPSGGLIVEEPRSSVNRGVERVLRPTRCGYCFLARQSRECKGLSARADGARAKETLSMGESADEGRDVLGASGPALGFPSRHALREQDALWSEFLASALRVVDSLA